MSLISNSRKLYIAGMGMITPVGDRVATVAAAVACDINAYNVSEHFYYQGQPLTLASVPHCIFTDLDATLDEGQAYDWCHDRVTKMAIIALREACATVAQGPIPLIMGMPEGAIEDPRLPPLIHNLTHNLLYSGQLLLNAQLSRIIQSGRAAGLEALRFVFDYLYDTSYKYSLVGGSDSYQDTARLTALGDQGRLLQAGNSSGFAPGEGACFLLLTRHLESAQVRNGHVIALNPPGISEEYGHLHSEAPYRGDGLDQAFKQALKNQPEQSIHSIYSGMNGEHYWSKEMGVARIRSSQAFKTPARIAHPADCYGDLGSATATALIALAAEHLVKTPQAQAHLVCCSSDTARRAAVVVEKIPTAAPATLNSPIGYF